MGCISGKKDCPLKIIYLDFALCNLPSIYAELLILEKPLLQNHLINEICIDRGLEILHWRFMLKVQKRTSNDSLNEVRIGDKISKDDKFLEYKFVDKDYSIKSRKIELMARKSGFKTELRKYKDFFIIKIYNNDIKLVKDFIKLFCEHDFPFNFPFS